MDLYSLPAVFFYPQNAGYLLCELFLVFYSEPFENPVKQLMMSPLATQDPEEGGEKLSFVLLGPPVLSGPFPGSANAGCALRGPAPLGGMVQRSCWSQDAQKPAGSVVLCSDHAPLCLGAKRLCTVLLRVYSVMLPNPVNSWYSLMRKPGGAGSVPAKAGSRQSGHRGCESRFPVH